MQTKERKTGDKSVLFLLRYIQFLSNVANDMEPIYAILASIPCERLWPWVGKQIGGSAKTLGVYEDWVKDNLIGDEYRSVEDFVNSHGHLLENNTALNVYKRCMRGEFEFFDSFADF